MDNRVKADDANASAPLYGSYAQINADMDPNKKDILRIGEFIWIITKSVCLTLVSVSIVFALVEFTNLGFINSLFAILGEYVFVAFGVYNEASLECAKGYIPFVGFGYNCDSVSISGDSCFFHDCTYSTDTPVGTFCVCAAESFP